MGTQGCVERLWHMPPYGSFSGWNWDWTFGRNGEGSHHHRHPDDILYLGQAEPHYYQTASHSFPIIQNPT